MWALSKSFRFEASHQLPHHDGKCANLHGHSWEVTVEFAGDALVESGPQQGMLLDYYMISKIMNPIIDKLDHSHLNDMIPNPTSENLALVIYRKIMDEISCWPDTWVHRANIHVRSLSISETCSSRCTFMPSKQQNDLESSRRK